MKAVYLLLGTNLGDRNSNLSAASHCIENDLGEILLKSSIYETEPWGVTGQQNYLNQVLKVNTQVSAQEILRNILSIEKSLGRNRTTKYASRIIDIDILFYSKDIVDEENLTIPHPLLHKRKFVLAPLLEIAPNYIHPVFHKSIKQLMNECDDKNEVLKIDSF